MKEIEEIRQKAKKLVELYAEYYALSFESPWIKTNIKTHESIKICPIKETLKNTPHDEFESIKTILEQSKKHIGFFKRKSIMNNFKSIVDVYEILQKKPMESGIIPKNIMNNLNSNVSKIIY